MYTPRQRISKPTKVALISTSIVIDILSIIPIVNWIVWVLNWIIFPIWLKFLGVSYLKAKRLGAALTGAVIELIPVLSILPGYTVSMILIIRSVEKEDKRFNRDQMAQSKAQSIQEEQLRNQQEYMMYMEEKAQEETIDRSPSEQYLMESENPNKQAYARMMVNRRAGKPVNNKKA